MIWHLYECRAGDYWRFDCRWPSHPMTFVTAVTALHYSLMEDDA